MRVCSTCQAPSTAAPAFGGSFELQGGADDLLALRWFLGRAWIALTVGLAQRSLLIEGDDGSGPRRYEFRS